MDATNKKIKIAAGLAVVVLLLAGVIIFYSSDQKAALTEQPVITLKEDLIKAKIGDFSIEEEVEYQGGTIIKVLAKKDGQDQHFTLFYKDNQLQRLPDDYVIESVKTQLSEEEKQYQMADFKYMEEYNTRNQDENGQEIIHKNVFLLTNELSQEDRAKSAEIYPVAKAKYEIMLIDEFGQMQTKFLFNDISQAVD